MRARFSAYVKKDVDFIVSKSFNLNTAFRQCYPIKRQTFVSSFIELWCDNAALEVWLRASIVNWCRLHQHMQTILRGKAARLQMANIPPASCKTSMLLCVQ